MYQPYFLRLVESGNQENRIQASKPLTCFLLLCEFGGVLVVSIRVSFFPQPIYCYFEKKKKSGKNFFLDDENI
jgi:hypothetical protein